MDLILSQLSNTLPQARSVGELARPLLRMLSDATGLESTFLTSVDQNKGVQETRYARNIGKLNIPEGMAVPWDDTLCKRALDEGRMYTDDVPGCWGDSQAARALGITTYLSAPIRDDEGELMGTLCACSATSQPLLPGTDVLVRLFSNLVGIFVQREQLLERLQAANDRLTSYALTDALTGLPNRRALYGELERLLARGRREQCSVLVGVLDLDGFKSINDTYGHQEGDADAGIERAVLALQERLTASTAGRYRVGGQDLDYRGASAGVVAVDPRERDAEAAVQLADRRMYDIKRLRKNGRTPQ